MTRSLALRPIAKIVLIAGLGLALAGLVAAAAPSTLQHDMAAASSRTNRAAFHDAMRQLWEDHIVWTRMVIVSVADDLPDFSTAVDRLLRNQDDIGNAIKPFYGDAAGAELSRLLREHITGAAALLTAAKAGDSAAVEAASEAWYANADAIAAFLAAANPRQWDEAEMQTMMHEHLDRTLAEAVARLQGRYGDDIAAYDQIHGQILAMADMLSDGIIAQFPDQFAR
jgi:hypothetical protein